MYARKSSKKSYYGQISIEYKKKQKYTPHSGKQECVSIYIKAIPT